MCLLRNCTGQIRISVSLRYRCYSRLLKASLEYRYEYPTLVFLAPRVHNSTSMAAVWKCESKHLKFVCIDIITNIYSSLSLFFSKMSNNMAIARNILTVINNGIL